MIKPEISKEQMLHNIYRVKRHIPFEAWNTIRDLIEKYGPGGGGRLEPNSGDEQGELIGPKHPSASSPSPGLSPEDEVALFDLDRAAALAYLPNADDEEFSTEYNKCSAALAHIRRRLEGR